MNKKTKSNGFGGWSLYMVFILAFVIIAYSMNQTSKPTTITKAEFELALTGNQVKTVRISQNTQVPTGSLTIQMNDEEIYAYIATKDPMDKAGAYGIQGDFAIHVKGIEGDYYNVVGLPIGKVYQELKQLL